MYISINVESQPPYVCKFRVGEKESRYVLVDSLMPFFGNDLVGCSGVFGIIEKAYSKLRYCYKGLLGVGIQQLIF